MSEPAEEQPDPATLRRFPQIPGPTIIKHPARIPNRWYGKGVYDLLKMQGEKVAEELKKP